MKRIILIIICICFITGCGNKKPDDYVGNWKSGDYTLDVSKSENDMYEFFVSLNKGKSNFDNWFYNCTYNNDDKEMVCSGIKNNIISSEENNYSVVNEYSDGLATFKYKNNSIIWIDNKNNEGENLKFK